MSSAPQIRVTALAPSATLSEALRTHWREYLMEGAATAALMLGTCICGTLVYSVESPLHQLDVPLVLRSMLMGIGVAITTLLIIYTPFGRRSGAHINPAVTLSFFWLGRVHRWDAACYVAAQFAGAVLGVLLAGKMLGARLSAPPVQYVVTVPGSYGGLAAFFLEGLLSAVLMGVVLYASNHRGLTRYCPLFVALLTVFSYGLSTSISGYSVNPARSFSSALFAWIWQSIWIYFLAPSLGMLVAAAVYVQILGRESVYCAKVFHDFHSTCPFDCRFYRLYPEKREA